MRFMKPFTLPADKDCLRHCSRIDPEQGRQGDPILIQNMF